MSADTALQQRGGLFSEERFRELIFPASHPLCTDLGAADGARLLSRAQ